MKSKSRKPRRTKYHREWARKRRATKGAELNARQRKWSASLPDKKERAHAYRLKARYGITPEQYDELFYRQQGCCAICKRPASQFTKRLAIDHDHVSLAIRGLLCVVCNREVIGRKRDPQIFYAAAKYLEQNTGWYVPKNPPRRKRRKKKGS